MIREPAMQRGTVIILAVPFFLFLVTEGLIIRGFLRKDQKECRWLIVLGAHVQGRTVTDSLARRLEKAFDYAGRFPGVQIVVSGGQGSGEDISEAQAMKDYLVKKGIKDCRIHMEERSKTTEENLQFSAICIEEHGGNRKERIGIVSNNFHLYRACCYAGKQGYRQPFGVAASCHPALFLNYMVREVFAVWKMWMKAFSPESC